MKIKSWEFAPYVISIGIIRSESENQSFSILLDADQTELNCVDQILHISIDKHLRIHSLEQSKCEGISSVIDGGSQISSGIPSNLFLQGNLKSILKERLNELIEMTK